MWKTDTELQNVTHIRYFSHGFLKNILEKKGFRVRYVYNRRGFIPFSLRLVVKSVKID